MTPSDSAPDLSRWDFQKTFSAYEIACLIQGIDPLVDSTSLDERDPVFKRVRDAYLHSLFFVDWDALWRSEAGANGRSVPPVPLKKTQSRARRGRHPR